MYEALAIGTEGFISYGQRAFQDRHFGRPRLGLCAGLLQYWWTMRLGGRDIYSGLQNPSASELAHVLLSQVRSVYIEIADYRGRPNVLVTNWYRLKFGSDEPEVIHSLMRERNIEQRTQLDLLYDLGLKLRSYGQAYSLSELAQILVASVERPSDLSVIILRFLPANRATTLGHRLALSRGPNRCLYFYDPSLGEARFANDEAFISWLPRYWGTLKWNLRVGTDWHYLPHRVEVYAGAPLHVTGRVEIPHADYFEKHIAAAMDLAINAGDLRCKQWLEHAFDHYERILGKPHQRGASSGALLDQLSTRKALCPFANQRPRYQTKGNICD